MNDSQTAFPTHLLIETTTRCNLRCKQCAHVVGKYAFDDMKMETFERLRPLFPHLEQVALYGHGETFLYKHFFEMLAELKQHKLCVYVTTNGTLLTDAVCKRLVELGLDKLAISMDAAMPELFNEIRRGADFEKVVQNIRRLNAAKQRAGRDDKPTLSLMFCAMKSNIQELPKLVRLADEWNMTHGVSVMNIVEYGVSGEALADHPEITAPYLNEANRLAEQLAVPLGGLENGFEGVRLEPVRLTLAEKLYRNYREFKRSFDRMTLLRVKMARIRQKLFGAKPAPSHAERPDVTPTQKMGNIRVKKCRDPWDFLFIDVHGNVRVCCTSHRIMGNVNDTDIATIWNSPAYQEFRDKMVSADIPPECVTCLRREWMTIP